MQFEVFILAQSVEKTQFLHFYNGVKKKKGGYIKMKMEAISRLRNKTKRTSLQSQ